MCLDRLSAGNYYSRIISKCRDQTQRAYWPTLETVFEFGGHKLVLKPGWLPGAQPDVRGTVMWGESLRVWFELFAGVTVHRVTPTGSDNDGGWINASLFEDRFARERLLFEGRPYDPSDSRQKNALLDAIIPNASALCHVGLLERRRNISPPSLDYRVTRFGRRLDSFGYAGSSGLRKRLVFLCIAVYFRLRKYWKLVAIGAGGWTLLNALKFYSAAFDWVNGNVFASVSAIVTAVVLTVIAFIKSQFERH